MYIYILLYIYIYPHLIYHEDLVLDENTEIAGRKATYCAKDDSKLVWYL